MSPASTSQFEKQAAFAALLARLRDDLDALLASQVATRAGATHEETRAEHPKDTRATEAAYLARGLAERVEALREAVAVLAVYSPPNFAEGDAIALGAQVELEDASGVGSRYLLAPVGGGAKLALGAGEVVVVTPSSPLGGALLGRCEDDEIALPAPGGSRVATVIRVS